ncbi:hypothetical protein F4819DRAFT_442504 [Hypoxylon fuscum]|nr:hypothetical protein F4819DRAFT_442504 [Hypoxylon fuscum]
MAGTPRQDLEYALAGNKLPISTPFSAGLGPGPRNPRPNSKPCSPLDLGVCAAAKGGAPFLGLLVAVRIRLVLGACSHRKVIAIVVLALAGSIGTSYACGLESVVSIVDEGKSLLSGEKLVTNKTLEMPEKLLRPAPKAKPAERMVASRVE